MQAQVEALTAAGEVTEREDLLDARVRLALEGEAGAWSLDAVFGWRRGRSGAIEIEPQDSYVTLASDDEELNAIALSGTVNVDPDTALARIDARLLIEDGPAAGGHLAVELAVGIETWTGTIRLEAAEPPLD
jgi:hypothetical protein